MKTWFAIACALGACTFNNTLGRNEPALSALPPGHPHLRWATTIGGLEQDNLSLVAVGHDGNIAVAGSSAYGAVDFQPPPAMPDPTTPSSTTTNNFVAMLSGDDGSVLWSALIPDPHFTWDSLATDASGDVYVSLTVQYVDNAPFCTPQFGVSLLKFDRTGQLAWRHDFDVSTDSLESQISVAADGTVALTAAFDGTIDLGGGPIKVADPCVLGAPRGDGFLAVFSSDGTLVHGVAFQGPGDQWLHSAAFTRNGGIDVIAVSWPEAAAFGGDAVAGDQVARLKADGSIEWSSSLPYGSAWGLIDSADHYVVASTPQDSTSSRLAIYDQLGSVIEDQPLPVVGNPVGIAPDGMIVNVGTLSTNASGQGSITFGDKTLMGDVYVGAYDERADVLGGAAFTGDDCSRLSPTFSFAGGAAVQGGIIAIGNTSYSIDLGNGSLFAHRDGHLADGTCISGATDGVVARFDWVTP